MKVFVIQYRQHQDSELKVLREGFRALEDAQRFVERRDNHPVKEPCTNYRYCTEAGEEYRITEVSVGKVMHRYYYTFGCDPGFPYMNGWVVVNADSLEEAHRKFRARFPDRHENTLNCSFFYDEEKWAQMDPEHKWAGWKLHEIIE